MRYVGGKTRIAGWIVENVLRVSGNKSKYLEPFVGSGAVFTRLSPFFSSATAGDAHPDLILMWQAIADGWEPPEHITREEYVKLRKSAPSALRGFAGFGASFGGKFFGGYVDTAWDEHWQRWTKPYLAAARTSVLKSRIPFNGATIACCDYRDHTPDADTVVYCDPPYAGTLEYRGAGAFDHGTFWQTMEEWSATGATVIVSEMQAPPNWTVLGQRERKAMLRVARGEENSVRQELLYWIRRPYRIRKP